MRKAGVAMLTTMLVAMAASPAVAQQSSVRGYDETLGVIGQIENNDGTPSSPSDPAPVAAAPQVADSGSLPFTGLDLGVVLAAGLLLLGSGFVLRRTTRQQR
jgi:hypothetical protein